MTIENIVCLMDESDYERVHGEHTKYCQHLIVKRRSRGNPDRIRRRVEEMIKKGIRLSGYCQSGFIFALKTMSFTGELQFWS
jgi:hypothetical protein